MEAGRMKMPPIDEIGGIWQDHEAFNRSGT